MNDMTSNDHALPLRVMGFTLIEVLNSITVLAILLMLTLPSFKTLIMNNRVLAQEDALANSLNYARNVALSQNVTTVTCPMKTQGSATCGTNWQNGWIVVSQPAAGGNILLQSHVSGINDPVLSSVAISAGAATSVTFDSRGIATTQANFKVCDNRGGAFAQSVEVLPTGFVQSGPTMGVSVWDNSALVCP